MMVTISDKKQAHEMAFIIYCCARYVLLSQWISHKYIYTIIIKIVILPSDISLSRISHAKIVGFSRLYCSILATTTGVATLGLLPPMIPGGLKAPKSVDTDGSEYREAAIYS